MSFISEILSKVARQDLAVKAIRVYPYGLDGSTPVLISVDSNGNVNIVQVLPSTITSGRKVVTSAGSAARLVASLTPCKYVKVCADLGNDNPVVVGGSGVVADADSQKGEILMPGNAPVRIDIDDVNKLFVDAQSNGDAVVFNYYL